MEEDNDIVEQRQRIGHRLIERLAVGRSEDHLVVVALRLKSRDAGVDRLYLHHHTRLAAERIIVDLAVAARGIIAQIVDHNFRQALVLGAFEDRAAEEALQHLGHHGKQIDTHVAVKRM